VMDVATKKEWLASLREADAQHQRFYIRRVVMLALGAILLGIGMGAVINKAYADPMAVGQDKDGIYTIYTEDCQLKNVVDLEKRATLEKDGKVIEGCVSLLESMPFFVLYIDKEIVLIRTVFFHRVTGA